MDLTIGGKTRRLTFGVGAFEQLELQSGKHLGWFLEELREGRCGFAVSVWLIWAGLLHDEPGLQKSTVVEWIDRWVREDKALGDLTAPIVYGIRDSGVLGRRGNAQPEADPPSSAPTSGS